jgi:hypothetical protein
MQMTQVAFSQDPMTPDPQTLRAAARILMARASLERIMRDDARKRGEVELARAHGDRGAAFVEAASTIITMTAEEVATYADTPTNDEHQVFVETRDS